MVRARRRDPVRHGGTAAVHATVGPQLAARRTDHQVNADKRDHRDARKGEKITFACLPLKKKQQKKTIITRRVRVYDTIQSIFLISFGYAKSKIRLVLFNALRRVVCNIHIVSTDNGVSLNNSETKEKKKNIYPVFENLFKRGLNFVAHTEHFCNDYN